MREGFRQFDVNLEPFENDSICGGLHYSIFELSVNTTSGAPSFVRSMRKGWETTDIHRNWKRPGRERSSMASSRQRNWKENRWSGP